MVHGEMERMVYDGIARSELAKRLVEPGSSPS